MPEDQITFRTDPRIKAAIAELVAQGEYRNMSDFMNDALLLMFHIKYFLIDGMPVGPEPLAAIFESPRGRARLRELLRRYMED